MQELPPLSKREREIMDVAYARAGVTVTVLQETLKDAPTRSALRSLLTILEDKGHLRHEKQGREFLYRPTVARQEAGRSALSRAIHTFFSGSLGKALAAHLSDPEARYTEEELQSISEFIETKRKEHPRPVARTAKAAPSDKSKSKSMSRSHPKSSKPAP